MTAKPAPRGLNSPQTNTIIKWMSRANTWLYRKTDGKIGGKFLQGAPVALLTTTGRKTGAPAMYTSFDDYQSWTDRVIPVVICDPR